MVKCQLSLLWGALGGASGTLCNEALSNNNLVQFSHISGLVMEEPQPNSPRLLRKGKLYASGAQAKSSKLVYNLLLKLCKSHQNSSCIGESAMKCTTISHREINKKSKFSHSTLFIFLEITVTQTVTGQNKNEWC